MLVFGSLSMSCVFLVNSTIIGNVCFYYWKHLFSFSFYLSSLTSLFASATNKKATEKMAQLFFLGDGESEEVRWCQDLTVDKLAIIISYNCKRRKKKERVSVTTSLAPGKNGGQSIAQYKYKVSTWSLPKKQKEKCHRPIGIKN